jgi:hypothetical protein
MMVLAIAVGAAICIYLILEISLFAYQRWGHS